MTTLAERHLEQEPDSSLMFCNCGEVYEPDEPCPTCVQYEPITYYCESENCKHSEFIATGIRVRCPDGHFTVTPKNELYQSLIDRARLKEIERMQAEPSQFMKTINGEKL